MNGIYVSGFSNPSIDWINPDGGISPCLGTPLPDNTTAFALFFTPVLQLLGPHFWYAQDYYSTPFFDLIRDDNMEEQLDLARILFPVNQQSNSTTVYSRNCMLFRPSVLPAWSNFIIDDWCVLIGLEGPESRAVSVSKKLAATLQHKDYTKRVRQCYDLILQHATVAFFCIDGISWEFYSREEHLLVSAKSHINATGSFHIRPTILETRQ